MMLPAVCLLRLLNERGWHFNAPAKRDGLTAHPIREFFFEQYSFLL